MAPTPPKKRSSRARELGAEYEQVRSSYEEFSESLRVLIRGLLRTGDIAVDQVTARAKETTSLVEKVDRRQYESLADVTDKCGVRVVTRYQSDIEAICDLLAAEFEVDEVVDHGSERPESFGYASRHLLICLDARRARLPEWQKYAGFTAEVQVRSILQHAWASISHSLDYKQEADVPAPVRRRLYRVAALLETGDELFDSFREEVEQLRHEYMGEAASDQWTSLPLDLDSLHAVWSRLEMASIASAAVSAGWREANAMWLEAEENSDESSRLLAIARRAGFERVGQLKDVADTLTVTELGPIRQACEERGGFTPFAIPADVLSLVIAGRNRSAVRGIELDNPFRDDLWRAALDRGSRTSSGKDERSTKVAPARRRAVRPT